CSECEIDTYKSVNGPEECLPCPPNTVSGEGFTLCLCSPGFTGTGGLDCVACDAGTYKYVFGSLVCIACDPGEDSEPGSRECSLLCSESMYRWPSTWSRTGQKTNSFCQSCPAGSYAPANSASITDCTCCVVGYTLALDGATCTVCDAGKYKAESGDGDCSVCPTGTSSAQGSVMLTDCKCMVGYTVGSDGLACSVCDTGTACAAGTYKSTIGTASCAVSLAGTYQSGTGSEDCISCPSNSIS
ncbi:hypothetical protein T484DRAFT_1561704, partial [Baffinella frigidus]